MFQKIHAADMWVLENFTTPLSLWLERLTNYNNFQQARGVLLIYLLLDLLHNYIAEYELWVSGLAILVCVVLYLETLNLQSSSRPDRYPEAKTSWAHKLLRSVGWLMVIGTTICLIALTIIGLMAAQVVFVDDESAKAFSDLFIKVRALTWTNIGGGVSLLLYCYFLARDPNPPEMAGQEVFQQSK